MRRGRKIALYRRERDSLEGPHEEAEIQRKVLRRGKNLAFSEDTCLEKERVRSKVTPRKVGVGLKRRWELSRRRLTWRGPTEKEASHLLGLRGRHQRSLCGREILMKRGKRTGPRTDPCGTFDGLERNEFCNFEKLRKRAYQKGKI